MMRTQKEPETRHHWPRLLLSLMLLICAPLGFIASCQSKLIYFPRPYQDGVVSDWKNSTKGKTIDFTTAQGNQRAFLQGNLKSPRNLWIVCGGNGTVALDWSEWIVANAPDEDAWLLVDFPGYGECDGTPSPDHIRESLRSVVPLACKELGWHGPPDASRLRFFGHSLGAAACLIAAAEYGIQRGVLLAPFTSTMEMSRALTGLPLGFLVTHRFDNEARLAELAAMGGGQVVILHGTDDEVIPIAMSRKLAVERKDIVRLIEIPCGRHNTLQVDCPEKIEEAMQDIGK